MRVLMCFLTCSLILWAMGCSKSQEELVHFSDQIVQYKEYNETLARYLHLVETNPEDPGEATQVGTVLEEYHAAVSKLSHPHDITLKALRNQYIRAIEKAQNTIEIPGDPMFSIEARRAIMGLQSDVERIYGTLTAILQKENLSEQYTLEWPTTEE